MHIMLDLETMGTRASSAIIAIGAVGFDLDGIQSRFYGRISLESNLAAGRTVDASTILWWLDQSDDARYEFTQQAICIPIEQALRDFALFVQSHGSVGGMWGNGADFDCAMLADAYNQIIKIPAPWPFYASRDLRTLRAIGASVPRVQFTGTKHNALADAENQALHAIEIYKHLGMSL